MSHPYFEYDYGVELREVSGEMNSMLGSGRLVIAPVVEQTSLLQAAMGGGAAKSVYKGASISVGNVLTFPLVTTSTQPAFKSVDTRTFSFATEDYMTTYYITFPRVAETSVLEEFKRVLSYLAEGRYPEPKALTPYPSVPSGAPATAPQAGGVWEWGKGVTTPGQQVQEATAPPSQAGGGWEWGKGVTNPGQAQQATAPAPQQAGATWDWGKGATTPGQVQESRPLGAATPAAATAGSQAPATWEWGKGPVGAGAGAGERPAADKPALTPGTVQSHAVNTDPAAGNTVAQGANFLGAVWNLGAGMAQKAGEELRKKAAEDTKTMQKFMAGDYAPGQGQLKPAGQH